MDDRLGARHFQAAVRTDVSAVLGVVDGGVVADVIFRVVAVRRTAAAEIQGLTFVVGRKRGVAERGHRLCFDDRADLHGRGAGALDVADTGDLPGLNRDVAAGVGVRELPHREERGGG